MGTQLLRPGEQVRHHLLCLLSLRLLLPLPLPLLCLLSLRLLLPLPLLLLCLPSLRLLLPLPLPLLLLLLLLLLRLRRARASRHGYQKAMRCPFDTQGAARSMAQHSTTQHSAA